MMFTQWRPLICTGKAVYFCSEYLQMCYLGAVLACYQDFSLDISRYEVI